MRVRKHPQKTCPKCGAVLWYGATEEPTGWKIYYICHSDNSCRHEWYAGRVARGLVDSLDEVFTEAEDLSPIV